jgi:hypothetical protein
MLNKFEILHSAKGLAVFEIIPIIIIFVLLINFTLGFFGVVHSGILNSIAARNYAFETFRNRANLGYFRDINMSGDDLQYNFMAKSKFRYHGIVGENPAPGQWVATKRPIQFSAINQTTTDTAQTHTQQVAQITTGKRVSESPGIGKDDFTKVWVRTVYGICLNKSCGDN